jgi:MoxR-like ATPase
MNVGQAYAGVNHVDAAMESRFDATLMFDYLPEAEEVELLQEQTSIDKRLAEWMVAVATEIRSQYLNRQLSGDLTPRGLLAWAQMVQHVLAAAPAKANQITEVMTALPEWLWIPTVAGQDAHGRINRTHREAIQQIILNHKPQGI